MTGNWVSTYDLDDLCQQDSISDILTQILDETWTAGLGQVVIGPVCVNLQGKRKFLSAYMMEWRVEGRSGVTNAVKYYKVLAS